MKAAVRASPCYATMVDEVCDMTIEKHMALCCKYVDVTGDVNTSCPTPRWLQPQLT